MNLQSIIRWLHRSIPAPNAALAYDAATRPPDPLDITTWPFPPEHDILGDRADYARAAGLRRVPDDEGIASPWYIGPPGKEGQVLRADRTWADPPASRCLKAEAARRQADEHGTGPLRGWRDEEPYFHETGALFTGPPQPLDGEILEQDDPMWSPLFEEVWHKIRFRNRPNYKLLLKPDQEVKGGRWYYQIECVRPDSITGEPGVGRGGKAYLTPHATRSELVQVAMSLLLRYDEHEAREAFEFDGVQVFGPHFDVLALHDIGDRTEHRGDPA